MCAKWPDHRAFSRISIPLSGEDGKGNLSWHVFFSGEATYARTEGKHNSVRKVLKHLFSHSHQKVEMMQGKHYMRPLRSLTHKSPLANLCLLPTFGGEMRVSRRAMMCKPREKSLKYHCFLALLSCSTKSGHEAFDEVIFCELSEVSHEE